MYFARILARPRAVQSYRKLLFSEGMELAIEFRGIRLAPVQQHAVSQHQRITIVERELALLRRFRLRKVFPPEWIRSEQTVSANVPTRRWSKAFRMAHYCNAD